MDPETNLDELMARVHAQVQWHLRHTIDIEAGLSEVHDDLDGHASEYGTSPGLNVDFGPDSLGYPPIPKVGGDLRPAPQGRQF